MKTYFAVVEGYSTAKCIFTINSYCIVLYCIVLYTELPHDTKFPIFVPKDNYLTTLIVQSMHKTVMHGAVCETLTHIRQTYWILQGRQLVKKIISKCVTCRKIQGPPFRSVPTPPLLKSRVLQSQTFQFTASVTQVFFMFATKEIKLHLKFIFVFSPLLQYEPYTSS